MKKFFLILLFFITQNSFANSTLYVPYAPGGTVDTVSRMITRNSKEVVSINKPGASGQVALQEMALNPGAMIITGFTMFVTNPIIYKKSISYDVANYEVIATAGTMPGVLACNKKVSINNIQDLLNYKEKLVFGATVAGGAEHLNTEILLSHTKNDLITVIPYQGGVKHYTDMLGGHIDCVFGILSNLLPFIDDPRLNVIVATHPIDNFRKNVPVWKNIFNKEFGFESIIVILIDKRQAPGIKNKILADLKSNMDTTEFKSELARRGVVPIILFDKEAQDINDKYNKLVQEVILKNNILFNR
jgi:tripartite-type tricarboxylate transporter receptor subunit TctC